MKKNVNLNKQDLENLINIAIHTCFDRYNKDTELLLRQLHKHGFVEKKHGMYVYPEGRGFSLLPDVLQKEIINIHKLQKRVKQLKGGPK